MSEYYLRISRASDLTDKKERFLYRLFEILPGAMSWGTLILALLLSWLFPVFIAFFIILYVAFWFFRSVYFSFHLRDGYKKMKENERKDWIKELDVLSPGSYSLPVRHWREIYHLIVVAFYKESLEIIRESFNALDACDYPKEKMIVVLAAEESAGQAAKETAIAIEREFGARFFKFLITFHPASLPGEMACKASNETWAVKKVKESILDHLQIPYENVIFSSLDADTVVFPKYFSCVSYYYLTSRNPTRTSFQPIPLFINNIWQASSISRVFSFSSTFWHIMNQERPEKLITFSSHSMAFKALVDVGFKQPNVVSDDSRIFWQCFLHYNGDYQVCPIYYPISMDANCAKTFWRTTLNIYKQQRRWAYGVGDIAYFLFGFLKNKKIPFHKKFNLGIEVIEGHWSWATSSILVFVLGWLPLLLGGHKFSQTLLSYNLPKIVSRILTLGMAGLMSSAYLALVLLPPKPPEYGRFKYALFALGWLLVPITMIFFTAFPALDAQTRLMLGKYMGFWPTEKTRK